MAFVSEMFINIFLIFIPLVIAEWELPEELRPPEKLFQRVGGFSPFLGFSEIEKDLLLHSVQTWLSESLETKYSSIVFDDFDSKPRKIECLMPFSTENECFAVNKQKLLLQKNESECFSLNSDFLRLKIPDKSGNCVDSIYLPNFGKNTLIYCRPPCRKSAETINFYETFLNQQLQSNQSCFCDHCVLVEETKVENVSGIIVDGLQISIIQKMNNVSTIQTAFHRTLSINSCLTFITTNVEFLKTDNTINFSRFSLQRGRFHCPNEVTCPWEIFYVFFQDDALFNPSYVFTIIITLSSIFSAYMEKPIFYYLNKCDF